MQYQRTRRQVARMADATLDHAPVWDALETFDGSPWRGVVVPLVAAYAFRALDARLRADRPHTGDPVLMEAAE